MHCLHTHTRMLAPLPNTYTLSHTHTHTHTHTHMHKHTHTCTNTHTQRPTLTEIPMSWQTTLTLVISGLTLGVSVFKTKQGFHYSPVSTLVKTIICCQCWQTLCPAVQERDHLQERPNNGLGRLWCQAGVSETCVPTCPWHSQRPHWVPPSLCRGCQQSCQGRLRL